MAGSQQLQLSEQFCIEFGVRIATSTYYRFSLSAALAISIASVSAMACFLHRQSKNNLFFHRNLRMQFASLCLCCLTFDAINIAMKVHHLALSFFHATPCQVFLPKWLYICGNVSLIFSLILSEFMLISILVERSAAVVYIQDYESGYRILGPALIAAAFLVTTAILVFVYYDERFDAPELNVRSSPVTTYQRSRVFFLSLLLVTFISLVLTIVLYFVSSKRQKRMTLSSRFQTSENANTIGLLYWIFFAQFTALFFSQMSSFYLILYQFDNPLRLAFRENLDFFNYYSLVFPILSMLYFARVKRRRTRDIRRNINIVTTGNEGWTNYSTIIEKKWT